MIISEEKDVGLEALVNVIAKEMKSKLHHKYKQGYFGWDDVNMVPDFLQSLRSHFDKRMSKENLIDIINLLAFLWNMADEIELHVLFEDNFSGHGAAD